MDADDPLPFEAGAAVAPRARNKRRSSILKTTNARPVLQVNLDLDYILV